MIKKYRKKPVVIEAVEWDGKNYEEVCRFVGQSLMMNMMTRGLTILTLEGEYMATVGDFIIRGIKGEFYPCKPDVFEATYDEACLLLEEGV